jgi:hypothetical protein
VCADEPIADGNKSLADVRAQRHPERVSPQRGKILLLSPQRKTLNQAFTSVAKGIDWVPWSKENIKTGTTTVYDCIAIADGKKTLADIRGDRNQRRTVSGRDRKILLSPQRKTLNTTLTSVAKGIDWVPWSKENIKSKTTKVYDCIAIADGKKTLAEIGIVAQRACGSLVYATLRKSRPSARPSTKPSRALRRASRTRRRKPASQRASA